MNGILNYLFINIGDIIVYTDFMTVLFASNSEEKYIK